jgi:uncharacterized protein YoaH (UPF0181 family)
MGLFDIVTAGLLIGGSVIFILYIARILRATIRDYRSQKNIGSSKKLTTCAEINEKACVEEIKLFVATKIEDGESIGAVAGCLTQNNVSNRLIAENIAKEIYKNRQKQFRNLGFLFIGIGGVVLIVSFALQEIMNNLMSELHRSLVYRTEAMVYVVKIVLRGVSIFLSIKGLIYILLGGKGIKTKRPV